MQKIPMKNKPVFLHNHDFQSIIVKVLFPFQEEESSLAKSVIIPSQLCSISEHYPTEEEFHKEKKRRMILGLRCSRAVIGTTGAYSFNLIIPDTYALGKDMLEEQFELFHEAIYHPFIENNGFSTKEVERDKTNLRASLDGAKQKIRSYQSIRIRELVDNYGVLSRDLIHSPEQIDEVTEQNLYEYYQEHILNAQPVIYVMGNVDEEKITSLCNKYLYRKEFEEKEFDGYLYYYLKPTNQVQEKEEKSTFKDSSFTYFYKIKDMSRDDEIYLSLLKDLLTSMSSRLLQKNLRDEKDLIYSSKVLSYPHFGGFEITAFIHKDNKEKVRKALDEVMKELKNEDVVGELLNNIKRRNHINLLRKSDDKYFLFEDYVMSDLGLDDSLEVFYQKEEKVTAHDISLFLDRMILDTILFIEEEEHE